MRFKELKHLPVVALVAVGLALAACCGGGGGTPTTQLTPQQMCEDDGGTWANGTCTTAAQALAARQAAQRMAISNAIDTAQTAVGAVGNMSTDAQVSAADAAIMAVTNAIVAGVDLPAAEKAANTGTVETLTAQLSGAKTARTAYLTDKQSDADKAMAATAAKLYAGISARATTGENIRNAAYNDADTAIQVTISGVNDGNPVTLSEDKKTTVAANHGRAGKRYADPAGGDSYEAVVYSNVEAPKQGRKFASTAEVTATGSYEYQLNATNNTELSISTGDAAARARVAFTGVTRTAGTETFKLPSPNPTNQTRIPIRGSYHGVRFAGAEPEAVADRRASPCGIRRRAR